MNHRFAIAAFALFISVAAPCGVAAGQDAAQPQLETSPLTIVSGQARHDFTVEVADEPDEISTGMMFRTEIADGSGMLFDVGAPRRVSFFMKNTLLPLDLLFIDQDGRVLAIAENAVPLSERLIDPGVEVKAVLELRGGLSEQLGLAPGDQIEHALFPEGDVD